MGIDGWLYKATRVAKSQVPDYVTMYVQTLFRPMIVLLTIAALAGCAGQSTVSQSALLEQHAQLLSGAAISPNGEPLAPLEPVDLLAVNDEMRAFLEKHIAGRNDDARKTELILKTLLGGGLKLHYNNLKTYTAEQAFREREGNCLSFTNLFIALAREAGVDARFQEVRIPPTWTADGGTFYYNLHINALVKLHHRQQIVDFDIQEFDNGFSRRRISDNTAAAQYYNNMGAYYLRKKDPVQAFRHARKAIQLRPNTGYFWTNLGTILRHAGDLQLAEQSYLVAIELSEEPAAMSNLARLYKKLDKPELAREYEDRVKAFRLNNPYYLYAQAKQAYAEENYESTQELLRSAIRQLSDEHQFYRLQGLAWLKVGEARKAKKSFSKAAKVATQAEHTTLYERKLQLLAQTQR